MLMDEPDSKNTSSSFIENHNDPSLAPAQPLRNEGTNAIQNFKQQSIRLKKKAYKKMEK